MSTKKQSKNLVTAAGSGMGSARDSRVWTGIKKPAYQGEKSRFYRYVFKVFTFLKSLSIKYPIVSIRIFMFYPLFNFYLISNAM
jgi:hypothetical protein